MGDLTHASFFSGAGGLDLGLERAGWRTVSFSEIDPYASAVLAARWPGVPNLGNIVRLSEQWNGDGTERSGEPADETGLVGDDWARATLWTAGFPCQDLSVAGKREGFGGERSSLAFAFLALVERYRPPAVLLENVPGLLSSHDGRDMARLLGEMADLGYGVAYRVLDARFFGVPQRRRRVFILGLRSDPDDADGHLAAERAAEVLAVGTRCYRHPPAGSKSRPVAAGGAPCSPDGIVGQAVSAKWYKQAGGPAGDEHHNLIVGAPTDPGRMRAPSGLAGRLERGTELAATLNSGGNDGGFRTEPGEHLVAFVKTHNVSADDGERWTDDDREARAMNEFDGDRTTLVAGAAVEDDPLLPLGLDSHRYRAIGNGVAAPVATWIGARLAAEITQK